MSALSHPSLPARPSFLPSVPGPAPSSALPIPEPVARPSTSSRTSASGPAFASASSSTACALCASPRKYTCPACSTPTCSLACSRAHKASSGCSGQRDPTGFVPLARVGQGEWAGDYAWLEGGRRRVQGWGKGVKAGEVGPEPGPGGGARGGRGGGPGARGGRSGATGPGDRGAAARNGSGRGRAEAWKRAMSAHSVWVDLMPEGMDRRRKNQSSWNPKNRNLVLTVELKLDRGVLPSTETDAGSMSEGSETGRSVLHPRVTLSSPNRPGETLASLLPSVTPHPADPGTPSSSTATSQPNADLVFLLPFHPSPAQPARLFLPDPTAVAATAAADRAKLYFTPLDPVRPLVDALKGTAFVEYPSVRVARRRVWEEELRKGEAREVGRAEPRKRAREGEGASGEAAGGIGIDKRARGEEGGLVGGGLGALGEYESDADEEEEDEAEAGLLAAGDDQDTAVHEENMDAQTDHFE